AALHPTSWTVVPSTPAEKDEYRQQERLRYQAPRRAFTYRLHGYRATVGPVRSGRDSKAGRGHALLTADRPPGVTLLSLVRDAVARLPNGEGSRADVCELVRDSGFLVAGSGDQPVSAAVSSAMDRLQAEVDPCLRYDSHRKVWMYLHRHRTEAEFETLERQRQASCPRRRQAVKRSAPTPAVSAAGGVSAAATVVAVGAAPAGASLLKPRAGALTVAQPKFSAPAPVPPIAPGSAPAAAAAVSAVLPSEPTTLTQTELAVQSILPAAPPNVPLAPAPASVAVPAPTVLAAAPTAASVAQLQLVSRAAALSPAVAASPPLAAVAGHPPTVQSVKVVKNQHTIVHIPSKTPGAAPQLALLANGKLIPIVNQPATVKAVDGRPRASLVVAPQRPVAAAAARLRPATPAVTVQEAPRRPLLSRPAPVAVAPVASAAIAPQQVVQVSGSAAVPAALAPASLASVTLGAPAAATSAAAVTAGSAGGALKHITIPVSQLSRLLQQQAGSGAAGALTLAQIGGRQVLIAARPAAKPPQPQLVQRVQAPTQTVQALHGVQSVHTVRPAQQVVLQAATHVVPASGVAPTRQISVATSQLQLAAGGAVSAVRPVAAGRPVVLSSAAQSPVQLLSGGLRTLHGYKLVQLPASAAASVQARGVSVATAVHQKPVQRPADLLAPLVAATLSSPAVAAVSSATAASPAVTQS
ncbi:nuclear factor related to kappa-B-binding protein-like, partial [Amphibalanus amphitrite]|uniref:nuclear factor related to kappa-B-binding protein-like n=1 Tax=Amphibalanus amphitrite TaxID=1232801 RepID=UPI001C8FCFFD